MQVEVAAGVRLLSVFIRHVTSVLLILTAKYGINPQSGTIIHSMSFGNTTVIKQVDIANPFEKRNAVRHSPLVSAARYVVS